MTPEEKSSCVDRLLFFWCQSLIFATIVVVVYVFFSGIGRIVSIFWNICHHHIIWWCWPLTGIGALLALLIVVVIIISPFACCFGIAYLWDNPDIIRKFICQFRKDNNESYTEQHDEV